MKKLFFKHLLLLFLPYILIGQSKDKYYSSEEVEYYEKSNYVYSFKPASIDVATKNWLSQISIIETDDEHRIASVYEDIPQRILANKSEVEDYQIIATEERSGQIASLYIDHIFDRFVGDERGYWIELATDSSINYYYTGLTKDHYYRLLRSDLPIWKNDSILQFRALNVRMIDREPFNMPVYDTIRDNLIVEVNLNLLTKDTDKDGLTDVVEDKMMTNPRSSDTDGDGISDYDDRNPRFKSIITNETLVYTSILNDYAGFDKLKIRNNRILDTTRTYEIEARTLLIVTDDPDIQKAPLKGNRYIILSSSEFETHQKKYPISFAPIDLSPLFKLDKARNVSKISLAEGAGGYNYLVTKVRNGYNLIMYSTWVY